MNSNSKPTVYSVVLNNFVNDSRVQKQAESLAANGYDVTVVARWEDGLEVFEEELGFSIIRIKLSSKNWPSFLPFQIMKYLEFVFRAFIIVRRGSIVHCNDLDALLVGYSCKQFGLKQNTRPKVIYDAHELETEVYGLSGFIKKAAKIFEKVLIRKVDVVMTVCDSIAEIYEEQYGIAKPFVVRNIPRFEQVSESTILRERHNIPDNKFIFICQGMFSPGRGLETMLDIAEKNQDDNFVIVFMGKGVLDSVIQEKAQVLGNVIYQPFVNSEDINKHTSSADCGICTIEDICLSNHFCLPNKMFEYMMAEIPIVVSDLPEMARFIQETGIGYVTNQYSSEELLSVMRKAMAADKSVIKSRLVEAKTIFNWEAEEVVLLEAYKSA